MTWKAAESLLQLTDNASLTSEQLAQVELLRTALINQDTGVAQTALKQIAKFPSLVPKIDSESPEFQSKLLQLCGLRTRAEYENKLAKTRAKLQRSQSKLETATNRKRPNQQKIYQLQVAVNDNKKALDSLTVPNATNVITELHKRHNNLLNYYARLANRDPLKFNEKIRKIHNRAYKKYEAALKNDAGLASRLDRGFFEVNLYGFHPQGQEHPIFLAPLLKESPLLPDWADKGFAITFMRVTPEGQVEGLYDASNPDSASAGPQIKATNQTSPDKVLKNLNENWINVITAVRAIIENPDSNEYGMIIWKDGVIIAADGTPVAKILHDSNNTNRIEWSQVRQIILNAEAIRDWSLIDNTIEQIPIKNNVEDEDEVAVPSHYWLTKSLIDFMQNMGCPSPDFPEKNIAIINDFSAKTIGSVETLGDYILRHRANQLLTGPNRVVSDNELEIIETQKYIPDSVALRLSPEQRNVILLAIGITLKRSINGNSITYRDIEPPLLKDHLVE